MKIVFDQNEISHVLARHAADLFGVTYPCHILAEFVAGKSITCEIEITASKPEELPNVANEQE
jgi:hypothetical protein